MGGRSPSSGKETGARSLIVALLVAATVAGLGLACVHNLSYSGIWFDEAVQFWIAQGQRPASPPLTPRGGVRDVLRANCSDNLDPGGFSLLLHAWTLRGRSLEHLRLLPLALYVAVVTSFGLLGWRLTRSAVFAAAAAAVPLLYPRALAFAFEIRAHTMEMAGIAMAALLLVWAVERPSPARLALLGGTCAAFLASRYSFAFPVAAVFLVLAVVWANRRTPIVEAAMRLAIVAAPVLAVSATIAAVILRRQLWSEMRSGVLGLAAPVYTRRSLLTLDANGLDLLLHNLFSLPALPVTLCALALLARRRVWGWLRRDAEPAGQDAGVAVTYGIVVATQATAAVASLLGLHPWDLASRWSVALLVVSALGLVALGADAVAMVRVAAASGRLGPRGKAAASWLGTVVAVAVAASGCVQAGILHRSIESAFVTDVTTQVAQLPAALAPGSVLVTFYEVPMVRYLFEQGRLSGDRRYPHAFRLEGWSDRRLARQADPAAAGIAYIINGLPPAELASKFPGATLTPVGGSRLMATAAPSAGEPR